MSANSKKTQNFIIALAATTAKSSNVFRICKSYI